MKPSFLIESKICNIDNLLNYTKSTNLVINYEWIHNLQLEVKQNYDITYIDTWHVYGQLKRELDKLLINEIYRVIHDFAFEIPWYVKSDTFTSNQWIEINVALVKSCMYLKSKNLLEVYNFGINNLARSLSRLGDDGAFIEGVTYAEMTVGSLLDIVTEIREMGDKRLNNYKFVDNCWLWICGRRVFGV